MFDEGRHSLLHSDRRYLVRAASRLLGPADAEDAVQDAYLRALEIKALALNSTQAWLFTVVRNVAIDRLRRRNWMQEWMNGMEAIDAERASPSAEMEVALAQESAIALQALAAHLPPQDGAALLLHEVFEVGHAEIADARGTSEEGSRQQLRRALIRLRQRVGAPEHDQHAALESPEETVFRLYLQALQLRNPQILWAMLRQPPVVAVAATTSCVLGMGISAITPGQGITCGVVQMGGHLALVLTLDGVRLCVVPLGVLREPDRAIA